MRGSGFGNAAIVGRFPCSPSRFEKGCRDVFGVLVTCSHHAKVQVEDVEENYDGEDNTKGLGTAAVSIISYTT